jgi:hypothetical protein
MWTMASLGLGLGTLRGSTEFVALGWADCLLVVGVPCFVTLFISWYRVYLTDSY